FFVTGSGKAKPFRTVRRLSRINSCQWGVPRAKLIHTIFPLTLLNESMKIDGSVSLTERTEDDKKDSTCSGDHGWSGHTRGRGYHLLARWTHDSGDFARRCERPIRGARRAAVLGEYPALRRSQSPRRGRHSIFSS